MPAFKRKFQVGDAVTVRENVNSRYRRMAEWHDMIGVVSEVSFHTAGKHLMSRPYVVSNVDGDELLGCFTAGELDRREE